MRVDIVPGKARKLIIVLLSLTLIMGITTVAPAAQDMIFTYSDAAYTLPATTFGDGEIVYIKATDNTTSGGTKVIPVANDQLATSIAVTMDDTDADTIYLGGFHSYLWSGFSHRPTHGTGTNGNYHRRLGWWGRWGNQTDNC